LGSLSRRGWVSRNFASTSAKYASASQKVESYNDLISFEILGAPAPTSSTGTAMAAMERLIAQLPAGIGYEWTGQSYEVPIEPKDECPVFGLAVAERTVANPPEAPSGNVRTSALAGVRLDLGRGFCGTLCVALAICA
jgi:hypothetical protein